MRVIATEAFNTACAAFGMSTLRRLDAARRKKITGKDVDLLRSATVQTSGDVNLDRALVASQGNLILAMVREPSVIAAVESCLDHGWSRGEAHLYVLDTIRWVLSFSEWGRNVFIMPRGMMIAFGKTELNQDVLEGLRLPYPIVWVETDVDDTGFAFRVEGFDADLLPSTNPAYLHINSSHDVKDGIPTGGHWCEIKDFVTAACKPSPEGEWNMQTMLASKFLWLSSDDARETSAADPSEEHEAALERISRKLQSAGAPQRRERILSRVTRIKSTRVHTPIGFGEFTESNSRAEHWVRGHWRLQWYGADGERIQRPKWVRPHRRCIGNGEIADERVYAIEESS